MARDWQRPAGIGWFKIDSPEAARILSDGKSLEFFSPFIGRTRTLSEAAEEVGCELKTMYYRAGTFLDSGLLEIVGERKRAGRAVKLYRSVSDGFIIPFELTPFEGLEERFEAQYRDVERLLARNFAKVLREVGVEARRIFRGEDGQIWSQASTDAGDVVDLDDPRLPPATDYSLRLRLTGVEARELRDELTRLARRYDTGREQGREFLLHVAMVPVQED